MLGNSSDSSYKIEIGRLDKKTWSNLLIQFNDASIYQTWSYASHLYGSNNISHVIVKKEREVVAIAQIGIRHFPYPFIGTANVHWGPLWKKKEPTADIDHFNKILAALKDEYAVKKSLLVRLWPTEIAHNDSVRKILKTNKFICNSDDRPYRTLRLDITPSLEELRKNLDQKWRNQLNRAEKSNLNIIEGTSDNLYKIFLKLQKEMRERKNYTPGVDYEQYRKIQIDLPKEQKMKIFVCEADSTPVAVAICSGIGNTGIYLLGATGNNGIKLNGSNLLQWRIIKWLKEHGCQYYDLGGIDPEVNLGVYRFKCGIAGKNGQDFGYLGQYVFFNDFRSWLLYRFIIKSKYIRKMISTLKNKN